VQPQKDDVRQNSGFGQDVSCNSIKLPNLLRTSPEGIVSTRDLCRRLPSTSLELSRTDCGRRTSQEQRCGAIRSAVMSKEEVKNISSTLQTPGNTASNVKRPTTPREETPPPLPPRPGRPHITEPSNLLTPPRTLAGRRIPSANSLQGRATTALSLANVEVSAGDAPSPTKSPDKLSYSNSSAPEPDDTMSVAGETAFEAESMLGEVLEKDALAWGGLTQRRKDSMMKLFPPDEAFDDAFDQEFNELDDITSDGLNEEAVLTQWKSKLKQYFILSKAGKPIWTRHGTDQLITSYIGVILTLISFYEGVSDSLRGFTAGNTRFVILSKNSLHLVAISTLGESDQQLRGQLEALYMQVLSTLTFPVMEKMFKARASTDLRRPLQGTERLLSALADGFTRGSPSTLLSALECLKIRKTHRNTINHSLLKARSDNLLYGLIAAGGRLVSVIRPRKHSLHPGDLHLVFNMLFEAGGVKASEGENWIPLCLPAFNNTGYVYMYVSFLPLDDLSESRDSMRAATLDDVAVILISANKEAFFELHEMKNKLVEQLDKNGSLKILREVLRKGRSTVSDIIPNSSIQHFLYKSRTNVQFFMPSYAPHFSTPILRRRLITAYTQLQSALHSKPAPPKILHQITESYSALAWSTQSFEVYALASVGVSRGEMSEATNKLAQHVKKEEERIFIIGGAVF
jgi:hypothetical protein